MTSPRFLGLAATLAIFTACGETPTIPQSVDSDLLTVAAAPDPIMIRASGGGKITGPPGQDQFSFSAKKRADGSVQGHVKFTSVLFGQLRGNVVCMEWKQTVQNPPFLPPATVFRTFLAIGTDMVSPDPPNTGPFFVMSMIDGGEGANAPPDKMLPDFIPGFAYGPDGAPDDPADACGAFGLPDFLLDVAVINNGNIQVMP